MRCRTSCVLFSLASLLGIVHAQSGSQTHVHPQPAVIDGAVNPELISDITAYRLYFLAVSSSSNPTDAEVRRQSAQISNLGIQDEDRKVMISILQNFRTQFSDWVVSFNERAKAAWDEKEPFAPETYLAQRDQIVQSAHDALQASLSHEGWSRLDGVVKSEKKRMKISGKVVGQ